MLTRPDPIETPRLLLVTLLADEIRALIAGDSARAGELTGLLVPAGWPEDADARDGLPWHLRHLESDDTHRAWRVRMVAERDSRRVVGSVGLKGPPNARGDVELGWTINHVHRRRGYATEAAEALCGWAMRQPGVKSMLATIADENFASQRVAARLGMTRTAETLREFPVWRRAEV